MVTRLLFPVMIVFSIFLLFAGHNAPGGGFAGGLVAGLALMIRYLAGGRYELDEAAPIDAGVLLGAGLFIAAPGLAGAARVRRDDAAERRASTCDAAAARATSTWSPRCSSTSGSTWW